jgi:very-short-patch-repair endonuclease
MRIPASSRAFARALRRDSTDAERRLWSKLRGRRFLGLRFRRQHPINQYFADFACLEIGLVIELDGSQHMQPAEQCRDAARTAVLAAHGFEVIRFWDNDVLRDVDAVLQSIARVVSRRTAQTDRYGTRSREGG